MPIQLIDDRARGVGGDEQSKPGTPGIGVIAKQFGVSPMTVQNVAN